MPDKEEQKPEEKADQDKIKGKEEKPPLKDNLVVTKHKARIGGKEIKYTVTAGTMVLKEEPADREKEWEEAAALHRRSSPPGAGPELPGAARRTKNLGRR